MKWWHVNDSGDLRGCTAKDRKNCPFKKNNHYPAKNKTEAYKVQELHNSEKRTSVPKPVKKVDFVKATPEEIAERFEQKVREYDDYDEGHEKHKAENWQNEVEKKVFADAKLKAERYERAKRSEASRARADRHDANFRNYGIEKRTMKEAVSYEDFSDEEIQQNAANKTFSTWGSRADMVHKKRMMLDSRRETVVRFNDPAPEPSSFGGKTKAFFTDQKKSEMKRLNNIAVGEEVYVLRKTSSAFKLLSISPEYADPIREKLEKGEGWEKVEEWSSLAHKISESKVDIPISQIPMGVEEIKVLNSHVQEARYRAAKERAEEEKFLGTDVEAQKEDERIDSLARLEGALAIVKSMSNDEFVVDSLVADEFKPEPQYHKYPV